AWRRDREGGIFFDPAKMHVLAHKGEHLSVRGPLNIARPIQGWPVIVQAGASEAGRQLAAETAEVVFGSRSTIEEARAWCFAGRRARRRTKRRPCSTASCIPTAGCQISPFGWASTSRTLTSTRR